MAAVVSREGGLRTGRRISHVFVMDVPTYHKMLIITDAAINIPSTLEDKVDICQNAIDLGMSLGLEKPKRSQQPSSANKGINSAVGGDPDILLASDLEAGNILAKQTSFSQTPTALG